MIFEELPATLKKTQTRKSPSNHHPPTHKEKSVPKSTMKKEGLVTIPPAKPYIDERRFGKIIDTLYRAIIHSQGIFKTVKMSTHAPQILFFPGAPSTRPKETIFDGQSSLFNEDDSPEVLAPVKDSREPVVLVPGTLAHIVWLWFATLTDRREDSMQVYKAHCQIYADHPEFYTKDVCYISAPEFRKAFDKKYKIGSPGQSAGYWQICALTLFREFDGDPIKLLKSAGWSVESVYAWKQAQKKPVEKGGRGYDPIPGWGRKLLSLFFLYLSEFGHPLPEDAFASDVHAQAILIQTGALRYGDRESIVSGALAEMIRVFVTEYCRKKNYDVLLFAHASWLLGSNLCDQCSKRSDVPLLCPIYSDCSGRVDTSHYWKKGMWPKKLQRLNKGGVRPAFGLPTDFTPRLSQRGPAKVISIVPLFPSRRKA